MNPKDSTTPSDKKLSSEEFRDVIGSFASGVTVVTTSVDGKPQGTTASAVSSLSLDPPMLLICMNVESATGKAIKQSGAFAVNILGEDHHHHAQRFASKGEDKFDGVEIDFGAHGQPLIVDALAHLVCDVTEQVTAGTHIVFIAEVHEATARPGAPLAYFRGQCGRLTMADVDLKPKDAPA